MPNDNTPTSPTRAPLKLLLARIHIAYVEREFTPPDTCPNPDCGRPLVGDEGVGVREVYFEQRECLGEFEEAEEGFPGGFEGGGSSATRDDVKKPEHPHGYACGQCGHMLVREPVTILTPDDERPSRPRSVAELMDALSFADPEGRVVVGTSNGQHRLLEEVEVATVRVEERTGTPARVVADARQAPGVETEEGFILWAEGEQP